MFAIIVRRPVEELFFSDTNLAASSLKEGDKRPPASQCRCHDFRFTILFVRHVRLFHRDLVRRQLLLTSWIDDVESDFAWLPDGDYFLLR